MSGETRKAKLEREAKLPGRRGTLARKALREAARSDCHHVPGVAREPRRPLRPDGRGLGDANARALRSFGG